MSNVHAGAKTKMKPKQTNFSLIAAVIHVSESEVKELYPDYDASWEVDHPEKLKHILNNLGLDTSKEYVRFDGIQHRNRLNQIVTCSRWYGMERDDKNWLESGYASQAALDKAKNNKLLEDSYRARYMTVDAQSMLERRDYYDER